jgi:uncharacterized protein YfiM (DUF2279 family)
MKTYFTQTAVATLIAFILIIASCSAYATSDDWTGQDKTRHAEWSFGYGVIASAVVNESGPWNWKAAALCMVPGVGKEYLDSTRQGGSGWSNRDLVADAVGCAAGVAVGQQTFVRFMHRNNKTEVQFTHKF